MKIQESAENYLETILVLTKRIGTVRSIDIVNELDFAKPSVSVYVRNLRGSTVYKQQWFRFGIIWRADIFPDGF